MIISTRTHGATQINKHDANYCYFDIHINVVYLLNYFDYVFRTYTQVIEMQTLLKKRKYKHTFVYDRCEELHYDYKSK